MIPNVAGAAFVGLLLLLIAAAMGMGLLGWWAWRWIHAARGTPRPPLHTGHWVLAVVLSLLPIATVLAGLQLWCSDQRVEQFRTQQDVWRHLTLQQPADWGGVVLPAGSHVERALPAPWLVSDDRIPDELPNGRPDLRYLSAVQLAQPLRIGPLWVQALTVYPPLLELARAYPAGGEDCQAGALALFEAKDASTMAALHASPVPPPLVWADWQGPRCFLGDSIAVRYWQDGALVWTQPAMEPVSTAP